MLTLKIKTDFIKKFSPYSSVEQEAPRAFDALIGTIVNENGYNKAQEFFDNFIAKFIFENKEIEKNDFERLSAVLEKYGKSFDDIHIKIKLSGLEAGYQIYYKDILLAKMANVDDEAQKEKVINQAIQTIEDNPTLLDKATNDLPYIKFGFPDKKRLERLNFLQKRIGVQFNDINLLHRAFLYGLMPDSTVISHNHSCKPLNYIGRAVYDCYCIQEINKNKCENEQERCSLYSKMHSSQKLADISKKYELDTYILRNNFGISTKSQARFFYSLLGAIYLDDKENGFNNVVRFLNNQCKNNVLIKDKNSDFFNIEKMPLILKEFELNIPAEKFDFLLKANYLNSQRAVKYIKTGKEFLNVYLRGLTCKEFPNKNESELSAICSMAEYGKHAKIKENIVQGLFDNKLFDFDKVKNKTQFSYDFLALFLGVIIHDDFKKGYILAHSFLDKNAKDVIIKTIKEEFGENQIFENNSPELSLSQKVRLEDFCSKYNIKISNLNLLNKVFMFGKTLNGQEIPHQESYEILEFVGDGVLNICIKEILYENLDKINKDEICSITQKFNSNDNLAKLSKKMNLKEISDCRTEEDVDDKFYADLFEALVGAIYIEGKEFGIENVCKFLEENFKEEILSA